MWLSREHNDKTLIQIVFNSNRGIRRACDHTGTCVGTVLRIGRDLAPHAVLALKHLRALPTLRARAEASVGVKIVL